MSPRFSLATVCIAVASCALLSPPRAQVEKAMLNQLPHELPHREGHGATILVMPPETSPPYDTKQIAYRAQTHEVAYFSRREWAATPSGMLYPLLVGTLENTRSFGAVLMPPYTGRYSYALRTEILELIQDFTSQPPAVVLSLRLRLTDYATDRMIATKELSVREPMQQESSEAGVVAANDAVAEALRETAVFILEKTD